MNNTVELYNKGLNIKYIFDIPSDKYIVLYDDSSKGKTTFYNMVNMYYNEYINGAIDSFYYSKEGVLNILPFESYILEYDNISGCIIVIDEDDFKNNVTYPNRFRDLNVRFKSNRLTIFDILKYSNNYYIIITRELKINNKLLEKKNKKFDRLPVHVFNMCYIETTISGDIIINKLVPYLREYKYNSYINHRNIVNVLTEDGKSSFLFFKEYFSLEIDKNLFSANGKYNVTNKLRNLVKSGYNDILVVYDACSFGTLYEELIDYIDSLDDINIYLLDWESFENYLLNSKNILNSYGVNDISNQIFDLVFNNNPNIICNMEHAYQRVLKKYLPYYDKSYLCDCLRKDYNCKDLNQKNVCPRLKYGFTIGKEGDKIIKEKCKVSSDNKEDVYLHYPLDKFIINNKVLNKNQIHSINRMNLF